MPWGEYQLDLGKIDSIKSDNKDMAIATTVSVRIFYMGRMNGDEHGKNINKPNLNYVQFIYVYLTMNTFIHKQTTKGPSIQSIKFQIFLHLEFKHINAASL